MVFAGDVEGRFAVEGVDLLRCCVLLGYGPEGTRAVVILERPTPDWVAAAEAVARSIFDRTAYRVVDAPRRTIVRTSSGKPRRRELWARHGSAAFAVDQLNPGASDVIDRGHGSL